MAHTSIIKPALDCDRSESPGEVAALVRAASTVLPIGAQLSLTGGATPRGEVLLNTSRHNRIIAAGTNRTACITSA